MGFIEIGVAVIVSVVITTFVMWSKNAAKVNRLEAQIVELRKDLKKCKNGTVKLPEKKPIDFTREQVNEAVLKNVNK